MTTTSSYNLYHRGEEKLNLSVPASKISSWFSVRQGSQEVAIFFDDKHKIMEFATELLTKTAQAIQEAAKSEEREEDESSML